MANKIDRRTFLKLSAAGLTTAALTGPLSLKLGAQSSGPNPLFWINEIPDFPFATPGHPNYHAGLEALIHLMGSKGLHFYRSATNSFISSPSSIWKALLSGPSGLIAADDIVLVKVNAQWKYRGATNSDLVRGLVQRLLDHPDGFRGEVVIFENGQGRGSLECNTSAAYGDTSVHANAEDESHSFMHLVRNVFNDPRVSATLLDGISDVFISTDDHVTDGYRRLDYVSYPCFTTRGGHRIELKEGVWNGSSHSPNLKLINVPVLKHHDTGGSEITACLKHFYGVLSMKDGYSGPRHYHSLGAMCGKMIAAVRMPVLNILDAIWVSHQSLRGYPEKTTFRANQLLAGQDPVALDAWGAKYILYPQDNNERHHPDFPVIDKWLTEARDEINAGEGLYDPASGILIDRVTRNEADIIAHLDSARRFLEEGPASGDEERIRRGRISSFGFGK